MALELTNLDNVTRKYMGIEIKTDIANGLIFRSKYLTEEGLQVWDKLLLEAAEQHDSAWLAEQLHNKALAVTARTTIDRRGHLRTTKLKPESLADSEFNRYYMRGLCLRAIAENIPYLMTYRAKTVLKATSELGVEVDPTLLLNDLRHNRRRTALKIPANPNSGVSVKMP